MNRREAFRHCEEIARSHYENFPVGWFLPSRMRPYVYTLYAFARTADDFADEASFTTGQRLDRLDESGRQVLRAAAGKGEGPLESALELLFRETAVTPDILLDLLRAFRQDVTKRRYASYEELLEYCRFSANPIGRAVLLLFGVSTPDRVALSDKICSGIQLVNHWQDVGVDLEKDRIYLPEEDLRQFDYSYDDLLRRCVDDRFRNLMTFEIERACSLLREGRPLVKGLPLRLRWQVGLMVSGPLKILERLSEDGLDPFNARPRLKKRDLILLFAASLWSGR